MNESDRKAELARVAKLRFDDSVDALDAATLSRLNRGRQRALAELGGVRRHGAWLRWLPATGVAAAALLAVMLTVDPGTAVPDDPVSASDFGMLLEDDLEMIEDLEFYSWLEGAELEAGDDVG
jgi:hypothetical protein